MPIAEYLSGGAIKYFCMNKFNIGEKVLLTLDQRVYYVLSFEKNSVGSYFYGLIDIENNKTMDDVLEDYLKK